MGGRGRAKLQGTGKAGPRRSERQVRLGRARGRQEGGGVWPPRAGWGPGGGVRAGRAGALPRRLRAARPLAHTVCRGGRLPLRGSLGPLGLARR